MHTLRLQFVYILLSIHFKIAPRTSFGRNDTLRLSTFSTTPIALIKTKSEVDPALMNGSGKPVGGTIPLNISCCIININSTFCYC